jgi:serine/threonine protein kinase
MTGHHHRSSTVDDERASKLDVGRGHLSMASRELHTPDATFSFATAIPVSVATLYFADPEKNGIFYEKSLASILHEWQRFRMECRRDLLIRSRTRLRALKAAALFSTSVVKSRGILTLKGVRRCLEHVDVRRIYLGHQQSRSRVGTEAATSLGFDNWDDTEGEQGLGSISSDDTGAAALDQQEQSASMSSEPPSDRKPATDATVPLAEPETGRSPKRMWTTRDDDDDDDTSEDEDVSYDSDSEYSDDESKDQLGRSIPATCSSRHESRAPQRSIALSDAASSIVDQSTTATATSELHRDTVTEATTTQNTITDTSATQPLNTQNKSTPSSGDYAREVERLERRASRWQLYTSHNLLPWGEQRLCDKFDQFDLGVIRRTRSWPTMGPHDASAHVDHTALMAGVFIEGRTTTGFEHFDLTEAAISLEAAARMLRHDITRLAELMEDNEEERIQFSTWLLRLATGGHIRDDLQTPDSLRGIHNPGATRSGADGLKQTQKADQEGIAAAANTQTTDQLQSLVKRTTMRSAEDEIQTGSIVDLRGIAAVLRMFWEDCIDVFEADFANRRHYYFSYSDADTLEAFQQLLDGIVESFSPAASLSVSHRESRHFLTTEEFMSLADLLARMYVRQKNRMECVGRYEIGRILGRGSEGRVHVARDLYTGRRYAIKMIRRGNFVEFARIDREVQAMQVVARHPNVIHLHEVLESRRHVYLVMELCGGGSVHEFAYARTCCSNEQLRRGKPEPLLDEAEARYLMRRLLTTVAFCHAHGVSHRDLRLNNLMLLDNGELKIADFGQVGLFSAGWDMFETNLVGSLYNLAPELVQGQVYQSTKVDVWSCGVILYWLLEGHPPFPEEDLNRLIPAIVQCRYAPMRAASPLARDLIQQILVPPAERPEAATLLEHAFFASPASTKTLAPHGTPEMAPSSPEAATGVTTNMAGQSSPPSSAWERPLRMDVRDFALCDTVMIQSMELDGGSLALQTMSSVLSDGDIHFHPGLCIELHRRCRWTLRCYWPEHDIKFSIALVAGPPRDDDGYLCCCGGEFQFHRRAFPSRRQRPAFVYTLSFRRRGGGSLLFMRAVCKIADRFYHRYQRVIQHADAGTLPDTEHAASECCQSSDPSSVGIRRGSLESRMNPLRFSRPVRRLLHRLHLSSAASRHESPRQAPSPGSSSGCGGVGPVGDE